MVVEVGRSSVQWTARRGELCFVLSFVLTLVESAQLEKETFSIRSSLMPLLRSPVSFSATVIT